MGADEKSILKKCGEILINLRMKNKKTKTYTFNCAYCDTNFDQLKKFSQHLEDKHLLKLTYEEAEEKVVTFEPEIKIEVNSDTKTASDAITDCESSKEISFIEDPLETEKSENTTKGIANSLDVKEENQPIFSNENKYDTHYSSNDNMDYEDCFDDNDDDYEPTTKRKSKSKKICRSKKKSRSFSDESSDDSNNADNTKKEKQKTLKQKKILNEIKVNEEELIIALLEAFKKQPNLWNVEERARDVNICQKGYEIIANEVSEKLKTNITRNMAKKRITDLRVEYSKEVEKQRRSEEFKMPWYKEHMDFLQENIEKMLELRKSKDSSDVSSDDSNDTDFNIDEELNSYKKKFVVNTNTRLKSKKEKGTKKKFEQELEIYSESERELIKTLFEAFKKQSYLWDGNEKKRKNDTSTCKKGFDIIANEVNEILNTNITANQAKKHINTMRIKYSYELEKQREGEDHHIPWYSKHMEFLQKNIDYVIRSRMRKRLNRRATKMDESNLLQLIGLYKKYEALWQVNNIAFGVIAKRDETLNTMIKDLKTNHNNDMTIENLQDYIKYMNRLYSKDKEQQLKCELENKEFTPLSPFYKELLFLSESQGPFKCGTCNEILPKYESYHKHIASHTNTMPFKCPLCEMGFKKFDKYIVHAKRHLGINSFQCSVCGKGYPFKSELDWHVTSHTGEKPYLCQVCGAGFRARHDYDNHIRRHEKRYRYECHICKHGFNQLHHYNDHVKSHLNIRDIICNICGKAFTAVKYLKNHKLIHDDTKRYKCNVCGKEFSQTAGLRQHRKQHQPHLTAAEIKRKNEPIPSFPDAFNF